GYQNWAVITTLPIYIPAGDFTLKLVTDTCCFNIDEFTIATTTPHHAVTIPGRIEVEDYLPGGQGVSYFDTTSGNAGGSYRRDDVDIQPCTDPLTEPGVPCYNVGWIRQDEWLAYEFQVAEGGSYIFTLRAATPYTGRRVRLEIGGVDRTGSIEIPSTGAYTTWSDVVSAPITLEPGLHRLRIVAETSSFNLNFVTVTRA
ncbi:MAG: carbohydrate-binding protein, partial [Chloroflexota bacterium]|nr:carbohydrate-binding protein [Chloroflexota bacterium]